MHIIQIVLDKRAEGRVSVLCIQCSEGLIIANLPEQLIKVGNIMNLFEAVHIIQHQA